jgi:hypothetical protein
MRTFPSVFNKAITLIFAVLVAYALIIPAVRGADGISEQDIPRRLRGLAKLTDKERAALVDNNDKNLQQTQETLIEALRSGDGEVKLYAAYLLGSYRFSKAAESLARNVSLQDKVRPTKARTRQWFWDSYPALEALIKIGSPAIPAVITNLTQNDDAEVRRLSLKALRHIDRDDDIVGLRLQKALDAQLDATAKARLQLALDSLKEAKAHR